MGHERQKLQLRRCSWSNLRSAVATTKTTVMTEGLETRRLVASQSESTRRHVTNAANALGEKLGAKIEEGVERMLNSAKRSRESTTNAGQVAFFSRLMAGLKAIELRELLVEHGIEPVGTKQTFAELVVEHLTQEDVSSFLASRGNHNKRQRLATGQKRTGGGESRQSMLDSPFARRA